MKRIRRGGRAGAPQAAEYSRGGSRMYRHVPSEPEFVFPEHEGDERITAHIEETIGPIAWVWHEALSEYVHVDVHCVVPTPSRPFFALVTSGMSARPMAVPPGRGVARFAELVMLLPPSWEVDSQEACWHWPVQWLKRCARLPHACATFLAAGDTIPNGDPARPFAPGTRFACMLVTEGASLPPAARRAMRGDGSVLEFLTLVPIDEAEMQLKLDEGCAALLERLEAAGVSDVVDTGRASVVPRRKRWFELF